MYKLIRCLTVFVGLMLVQQLALHAQSITVSPQNSSVAVSNTLQFSAQVTGLANTAVTWYVEGVKGGNSTYGTIDANGLYTAPASVPGRNPVEILAQGQSKGSIDGIAWLTILSAAPTITSLTPNPLPVGTDTITIQGNGFKAGATVFDTYGNTSVQLTTLNVSPSTLTAVGYQGNAASATFKVKNPGSAYSNNFTVPVVNGANTYTLTVVNGTGGGTYAAGVSVAITANTPPAGQVFTDWTGGTVANANASTTTITMPAAATTVTANYAKTYALTVVNGTGGGSYLTGTVVTISANAPPAGQVFTDWTGGTVANANASTTTITMPAAATTVTANYAKTYALTVVNGTGGGSYLAGTVVTISDNTPPAGQVFTDWTGATVANANASSTTITIPAAATTVTANYAKTYALTVVNGTGGGSYLAGTVVTISANTPPAGQIFTDWTGATVASANASSTTITIPAAATTVTANYAKNYALTVVNGTGSGSYLAGTVVSISANAPAGGQQFVNWTGAPVANATASSTTITISAAATVTANYTNSFALTVVNGTGSNNYQAGTVVTISANTPPAGQQFLSWTGAAVANSTSITTTIAIPAAASTVTATYGTNQAGTIPFPVSSHPRLWVTTNDLARLKSWAVATNPIYQAGLVPLVQQCYNLYTTEFFPGGQPNLIYPDPGDINGNFGTYTEQIAAVLAFESLIDPNANLRIQYAQAARNMLMYALNLAKLGHLSGAPFRDPDFAIGNRSNYYGEGWPLIVDWIYNAVNANGNPILTATDKQTIRNVFIMWANDCLTAEVSGGDSPSPAGVTNSLQLLPNKSAYRMANNNYYLGHARLLTMMSLCIDPSDDPPVNATVSSATLGNSLRSFIPDATGAWLYQEFAMMGDPGNVAAAYGIQEGTAGLGIASGGLPPEGLLYGHSYAYILDQLLALQTAGFNNPALSGPQIGLIGAPVWDRYVQGFISQLTPTSQVYASEPWLGPMYQFGSYGDLIRLWAPPEYMQSFALLALLEQETGSTTHVDEARWFTVNVPQGGASGLMTRITDPWAWSTSQSILYFLLLDPTQAAAADPRPNYPTNFTDAAQGRIVAHSDWSATNTMFDYRASWNSIPHQQDDAGQFELFRNGEWLTKGMSNYDSNEIGQTPSYHNSLALKNWCVDGTPANLGWYELFEWSLGSQWMLTSSGDPTTLSSSGAGYTYAASDLTKLYNRPSVWSPNDAALDITQATRSIIWLNNDYIVVYDRATSIHPGLFKQFNLCLANNPAIGGNTATETMADGQQLFIQTLLPASPTITSTNGAVKLSMTADLEPTQYILTVQDNTLPANTRFLHVLQGANPGAAKSTATYLTSSSGTSFDGAMVAGMAVYFPVSAGGGLVTSSFPAPSGVNTMYIAGLTPGDTYGVRIHVSLTGFVVTLNPNGTGYTADSAGLLQITL